MFIKKLKCICTCIQALRWKRAKSFGKTEHIHVLKYNFTTSYNYKTEGLFSLTEPCKSQWTYAPTEKMRCQQILIYVLNISINWDNRCNIWINTAILLSVALTFSTCALVPYLGSSYMCVWEFHMSAVRFQHPVYILLRAIAACCPWKMIYMSVPNC